MSVDAVFFDRDLEHLTGAGAVNVAALGKDILPPLFTGEPRDDTSFDGAEV